jgi:hypothetical protein
MPRKPLAMSKKLEKRATRLARKAENRVLVIRRVVREYRDATQTSEAADAASQAERNSQIERAVGKYNEVHKALRRIRKKIQLKTKDTPAVRAFGGR